MELKRVKDWRTYLSAHINEHREKPFVLGQHDCALWAGSCIKVTTGHDFTSEIHGTYRTPEGAVRALKKVFDADNLKEVFSTRFSEVHIAYARPGDIVYRNSNMYGFNCCVGLCYGVHSFFISEDDNCLVEVPTIELDGGWWIG